MFKTSFYVSRKILIVSLAFVALGAACGFLISSSNPAKYSASVLFRVGGISNASFNKNVNSGSSGWNGFTDEFLVIENFLGSPETAEKLANNLGKPEAELELKSYKYGGFNALSVKEFPKMPLIFIRVVLGDKELALRAASNAAELLLIRENMKIEEWVKLLQDQAATLKKSIDLLASDASLAGEGSKIVLDKTKSGDDIKAQNHILQSKSQLASYWVNYSEINQQIELQNLLRPAILLPASIDGSLLNSTIKSTLLGAVVGLLIGLLILTFGVEVKFKS